MVGGGSSMKLVVMIVVSRLLYRVMGDNRNARSER
jgi:hypothetical protein